MRGLVCAKYGRWMAGYAVQRSCRPLDVAFCVQLYGLDLFVFSQKFERSPAFTPVAPTWQPETCSRLLCFGACDVFSLAALLSIGP